MNELTVWQKIKTGFWLGIGFVIPLLIMYLLSIGISLFSAQLFFEKTFNETEEKSENEHEFGFTANPAKTDLEDQITILGYRESASANRLLILGDLINNGPKTVNSIQIQAELFDSEGQFIYECDEYFSKKINTGEKENFQIKCGCGDDEIPKYTSLTLRVLKANNY